MTGMFLQSGDRGLIGIWKRLYSVAGPLQIGTAEDPSLGASEPFFQVGQMGTHDQQHPLHKGFFVLHD